MISNNLIENVRNTDIRPGIKTDHSAIAITFQLYKEPNRGPGHWKFNNSFLEDENLLQEMNSNLRVWLGDPSIMDQQVKWEWIKFKVRESAMKFAKEKSRLKKDIHVELLILQIN